MRTSWRRPVLGAFASVLAALALAAPAGAVNHPFLGAQTPFGVFEDACGLAVDSGGHRYVADYYHRLIETSNEFAQGFITELEPGNAVCDLAVDSQGRLYGNNWHQSVVRYTPSAYPFPLSKVPTYGPPQMIDSGRATGVAVDPATNRVYVSHRDHVSVFTAAGSEVMQVGVGSLGDAYGLAVSGFGPTAGRLYVADAGDDTVKVYEPAGPDPANPVQTIDGAATPQAGFADLRDSDLAVDDSDGHLFVVDKVSSALAHPAAVVDEFGRYGDYLGQLPHALVFGRSTGIAVDNSDEQNSGVVYVTSGDSEGSVVYGFCPAKPKPTLQGICPTAPSVEVLVVAASGSGHGTVKSQPAGIACGSACTGEFVTGSTVTLAAAADTHSAFTGWTVVGNPGACPGTGPCQVTMSEAAEVSADFVALPQRTLVFAKGGTGQGTVKSQPVGVDCSTECAAQDAEFSVGSAVTLTAVPRPHSVFVGWTVAGSPGACPGTGPCTLDLDADTELTATFAAIPQQTLSVGVGGPGAGVVSDNSGAIRCGAICAGAFDQGKVVVLSADPTPASNFTGWTVVGDPDACPGTGPCQVMMSADTQVNASFGLATAGAAPGPTALSFPRILAISVAGDGSGAVASDPAGIDCGAPCSGAYAAGARVVLTATPEAGSAFGGWSGCDSVAVDRCVVTLSSSRTVGALFTLAPSLSIEGLSIAGAKGTLEVAVPGPGSVSVSGKWLKPIVRGAKAAGTLSLPLTPSRAGKRALAKHRKLTVKLAIAFKPKGGTTSATLEKAVTFKQQRSG